MRRELSKIEVMNLKRGEFVYIEYLDEKLFDLDYCNTVNVNQCAGDYFFDDDANITTKERIAFWMDKGYIKVYEVNA